MKKALFPVLLAAAIVAGAGMVSAFAEGASKDRVTKPEKIGKLNHKAKVKASRLKKRDQDTPTVKNNTIQEDYYTTEREKQIKTGM
jgi:hypothetical protein